jgi:hypothetical protein
VNETGHEHPPDDSEVEIISLDQPSMTGERNYIPFVPLPQKIRSARRQLNRLWLLAIVTSSVLLTFLVIPDSFSTAQSMSQQVVLIKVLCRSRPWSTYIY